MGLYSGGLIIGRIFAFEIWGAYFQEGLFLEGLIIGILHYDFLGKVLVMFLNCAINMKVNYFPFENYHLFRVFFSFLCVYLVAVNLSFSS